MGGANSKRKHKTSIKLDTNQEVALFAGVDRPYSDKQDVTSFPSTPKPEKTKSPSKPLELPASWTSWKTQDQSYTGENLDTVIPEVMVQICAYLRFREIQALSCLSKKCAKDQLENILLWQYLCKRDLGENNFEITSLTNQIGLARKDLPWRDYFLTLTKSSVFTWGNSRSIGRAGTESRPQRVPELDFQSISYVGKTAEVGSICINKSGTKIFVWGSTYSSSTPVTVEASHISQIPGDTVVHCSCGHDSRFLLVMESGNVFRCNSGNRQWENMTPLFTKYLDQDEKMIWTVGSQNGTGGFVTNKGKFLVFTSYYYDPTREVKVFHPPKKAGPIVKVGFGHLFFYAITREGKLYQSSNSRDSLQWEEVPSAHKIIDVDGGTRHAGYVNEIGEVWTWGSGTDGVLGHGTTSHDEGHKPKRVEWFIKHGIQIVAIGCGGHSSWYGGFTLFLTSENKLYMVGRFPFMNTAVPEPQLVELDSLEGRHILSISAGEDWAAIVASGAK